MLSQQELHETLADAREAFLDIAVDRWRITKPDLTTKPDLDEWSGTYPDVPPILVYEGPGRLQIRSDVNSNVVEVTAGEREWAYQTATLQLPVLMPPGALGDVSGTADIRVDFTAECLDAPEEPGLVGRKFQVRAIHHKTHATSRRLRVTEAV